MLFKDKYFFLSNMITFPYPILIDGLRINSSENYYQAMKTDDKAIRKHVSELNPYEAKEYFKYKQPTDNHTQHKLSIMTKVIYAKFDIPVFKYLLLSTTNEELIADNTWGETYWGKCNGSGSNHLGSILMRKRKELQDNVSVNRHIKINNLLPINKIYTGIGSRNIPSKYRDRIYILAELLNKLGYTLRSGGADGSDSYFEEKAGNNKEIYLPWKNFNNSKSSLFTIPNLAKVLAEFHHPNYVYLKESVKKLMNRNILQVIGKTLNTPSDFVICYTEDGCERAILRTYKTGGTGLAISLADTIGVTVYNIKNDDSYDELITYIKSIEQ